MGGSIIISHKPKADIQPISSEMQITINHFQSSLLKEQDIFIAPELNFKVSLIG